MTVTQQAVKASEVKQVAAKLSSEQKNSILLEIAQQLRKNCADILKANEIDVQNAKGLSISETMIDRLTLTEKRIDDLAKAVEQLCLASDPIGEVVSGSTRPNGLKILEKRVPLGLVAMIYESRPNVTIDAAALAIKSGNACILRGGKEAINSNIKLIETVKNALENCHVSTDLVMLVTDTTRESATELMNLVGIADVLIPRGSKGLIDAVVKNSKVPVIETGAGNCHIYVDEKADFDMALAIVQNAKMSRPSVCNSAEKLLVSQRIARQFIPLVAEKIGKDCGFYCCEKTADIIKNSRLATEQDWYTEFNDYVLGIKIVDDVQQAVHHINEYGTKHSEAIITECIKSSEYFLDNVDAAAVYLNASTRFTDGGEFGLSAEIGISTGKLHARGPMGLSALTTTKFYITGNGQIRV